MATTYNELLDDLRETYSKVRKMLNVPPKDHAENTNCETKNEAVDILKEMKMKLESMMDRFRSNEIDIKSMLGIVLLNIGIILIDNEEFKDAEDYLTQCVDVLGDFKQEPSCILVAHSAYHQLGIIWFRWGEFEKAMKVLEKCHAMYDIHKNIECVVEPIGMSAMFGISNSEEPSPKLVLEQLHTLTLYYKAQIYGASNDHENATLYCHMTLQRQLEFDDFDPIDWALNAATLSQLYMELNNFTKARYDLAAASHMLNSHEKTLIDGNSENDEEKAAKWERFRHRNADVARCWAKYGLILLSISRDRLYDLTDNVNNEKPSIVNINDSGQLKCNDMCFKKLENDIKPITEQITDKYLLDFNDAKKVFLNVQNWLNKAKEYYALETHASDYVQIIQDISQSYKHLSFFEDDEDRQAKMHKRRIDILENVIAALNPRYYQLECRQMWIELAETFSAILEIKLDKLRATDDRPTPHALTKINQLSRSSIKYYQCFLDSFKADESAPAVREFPDEMVRPALLAYFHIGTLYNKLITPDKNEQIKNVKNSINAYNFFVEYCETHADAAIIMKVELNVCKDFAKLLPLKLSKLQQIVSAP